LPSLTSLAAGAARQEITRRFTPYGIAARAREAAGFRPSDLGRLPGMPRPDIPSLPRANISDLPRPSVGDVEERLLDRLDPASQLARLSRFFWRRERLAALRGRWMYYYTNLKTGGSGLAGVNLDNGRTERELRLGHPDPRFTTAEETGLLYTSQGNRLHALPLGAEGR
jgi:hypothetical protein